MKYYLMGLIMLVMSTHLLAQQTDLQGIEQTLGYYLDGGTNSDRAMVAKAFHPEAELKFVKDGKYQEISIADFLARIKPGKKSDRITSIKYINITGHVASANVEIEYADFKFIDYFNLLKIEGEWKIVNKIFYRQEKGEKGS